jgi:hypothetical protein
MDPDPTLSDPSGSFSKDPKVIAAVKKIAAALDASSPNWRSHLSPTGKFFSGHMYRIDPARLLLTPERQ